MNGALDKPTPDTLDKPEQAITLAHWPAIATKLAAVVVGFRFKLQPTEHAFVRQAIELQVTDTDTCTAAGTALVVVKRLRRNAETHYETLKRPFNGLLAVIRDFERVDVNPLVTVETQIERRVLSWRRTDQQRQREEQDRLQRDADRQAKEAHDAQVAALQRVAAATPEPALREAIADEAAMLAQAPVIAPTVAVDSQTPVVPGLSFTKRHRGELRGDAALLLFVKAIGQKKIPLALAVGIVEHKDRPHVYRSPTLDAQIRAHDGICQYPGVTIVEDEGATGR